MRLHRLRRFLMLLLVVAGCAIGLGCVEGSLAAGDGSGKITGELSERLEAGGQVDFIVRFVEQADLSAAYSMEWNERGWYVYNTLLETTQRSQGRAQAYLISQGLRSRSYIAGNEVYVYAGSLEHANNLARFEEVLSLYAPPAYAITPSEVDIPIFSNTWAGELLASKAETTVILPQTVTWGIDNVNANDFWTSFDVRGEGILVANIDTGVLYTHEALASKYACAGGSSTNCWYDPDGIYLTPVDLIGHGTHTMGTMVGSDPDNEHQIGVAPNARWIACQGCDSAGCETADLWACADWMLAPGGNPENRPQVVNNSWSSPDSGDVWFVEKVNAWRASGIFPAFSAGNYGPNCSTLGNPGSYQESFATAGHDSIGLEYSIGSRGPSPFGHEPYTKPNLSGPGVNVISSYNRTTTDYYSMSGTSMATPHTAGTVALLWSCNPTLVGQVDTTVQLLQNTARAPRLSTCGAPADGEGNYSFGYGYLDVMAAGIAGCGDLVTGVLSGHVYDQQGNPLAGASVSAISPLHTSQTLTDTLGAYSLTLVVDTYTVTAERNGYETQTVPGVGITFHQTTVQDFHLPYLGLWTIDESIQCFDLTRFDAEYFPATGKVYILGGRFDLDEVTSTTIGTIYVIDPVAHSCTNTGASMPVPISNYTINLVNDGNADLLCTFGGRIADGSQTRDVQCYDPLSNTVIKITELPEAYTGYTPGAQVVFQNQVYIFGGVNPTAAPYNLARTDRYNPLTKEFTQLGDLSLPRAYIMAAVVDGQIYAFGGDILSDGFLVAQTRAEVMADPLGAGVWNDAAVADLPIAAGEGRAFGFDSTLDYDLSDRIVISSLPQWPAASWEAIVFHVSSNTYDLNYPNLNIPRRNHAGVFIPINTSDPGDGLPGMWVFGGFCSGGACGGDYYPYAQAEFYPVYVVERIYAPVILK